MWLNLVNDVKILNKDISDNIMLETKPSEKQFYSSLPRPGVRLRLREIHVFIFVFVPFCVITCIALPQKHGTTSKFPKPTRLDQDEQARLAKSGLDMKMISSEVGAQTVLTPNNPIFSTNTTNLFPNWKYNKE